MRTCWAISISLLCLSSCGGDSASIDERVSETVNDTSAMREATAAANQIIRNATDCSFVQANFGDVTAKLDEIASRVQTAAGRTSLQTLRTQVKSIADACGAR